MIDSEVAFPTSSWKTVPRGKKFTHRSQGNQIPQAVQVQNSLRQKYNYKNQILDNGDVVNNTTLYVKTTVAHPHQVAKLFEDAKKQAKSMPEIFGHNFDCDIQVNVVRTHDNRYMGYAFVDVTNPEFYYALIGKNLDGSDRAEYIDDPDWVPPITSLDSSIEMDYDAPIVWGQSSNNWADEAEGPPVPPKIRKELEPLLVLGTYEYEPEQKDHLKTDETHGNVSVSQARFTPGVSSEYDNRSLYVAEVPSKNVDFLYQIFARYARNDPPNRNGANFYPQIDIRETLKETEDGTKIPKLFAIVKYAHPYDAASALNMLLKIRANYEGKDIVMPVRYAYKPRR